MFGRLTVVGLVGLAALAAGCAGAARVGTDTHWHTKVYRGTEGKVGDQKSIAHTSMTRLTADRARASVTLPGLIPRGSYAWGVYQGSCAATGSLMGSEANYPTIEPDANSMGSFTALVDDNFDAGATYNVTIFTNGGGRDAVLGCNVLRIGTEEEYDAAEGTEA
ncbi:MAG TPA: hypothetical protein VM737_04435 [Gemmatimonadota bacterium]|nr:hypothetical protein [Gemmatimonadota bacterium]